MKCNKAMKEISSYLDGELTQELKLTLEAHLTYCNHCHAVFDSTKKTIDLYCDGKLYSLPDEVRSRLHDALRRKLQEHK